MDWSKFLNIIIVVLFTSTGQLLMRSAMRTFNTEGGFMMLLQYIIQTPLVWLALACYGVSTFLWLQILSRYPVGAVYPMVALGYVIVTLGGIMFLGERVPTQAWMALTFICIGTLLLGTVSWQTSQ